VLNAAEFRHFIILLKLHEMW